MRKQSTIILGIVSLILTIVISAVERSPRAERGLEQQLLRFDEKNVQGITLMRGGQTVEIKHIRGYWFFTSPEAERINSHSMASLLDQLNHLSILDRFKPDELINEMAPANLGLVGEEALQVVIQHSDSGKPKTETLVIGRAASRANSVYACLGEKFEIRNSDFAFSSVAIVNGNPHEILDDPYSTLLERQLVNLPANGMAQLAVQTSRNGVVVQRRMDGKIQTPWAIVQPIQTHADQDKVEKLIASLLALQISDREASSAPEPIPSPIPEHGALIQFGILGSEKPIVLYLEKDNTQTDDFGPPFLTARISDRPGKYRLNSPILESLNLTASSLRDRRLGKIPESLLESIAIVREEPKVEIFLKSKQSEQGVNWDVLLNDRWSAANVTQINRLIAEMDKPLILDFIADGKLADFGIQKNTALELRFNLKIPGKVNPDGTVGEAEIFPKVLRLGKLPGESERLFGNFLGEPHIYELPAGFASLIPTHPVKWKSLTVMSFERWNLLRITKDVPGQEKIALEYVKSLGLWKATRDGVDVSNQLDRMMADNLRDRLASLKAISWNLNVAEAYKLLEKPAAAFTVTTEELDPATNTPREVVRKLRLVESNGFVHGRVDENPDLFFIEKEKYKSLLAPLTSFSPQ